MILRFSSPAFDDEPTPPDAVENAALNEAEYLDNCLLDERLQLLHDKTRVQLCDGQKLALSRLHGGIDILLVAKTGFGKTLIFIGFHLLLPASKRAITLIISPLIAIEQDQALDLNCLFGGACLPLGRIIDRIDTIRPRFSLDRFVACFQAYPERRALLLYRHQVYIPPIP